MTAMQRQPIRGSSEAMAMPRLPEVDSTTTVPGTSGFSRSSIRIRPIAVRSLIEPVMFFPSSFSRKPRPFPRNRKAAATVGVILRLFCRNESMESTEIRFTDRPPRHIWSARINLRYGRIRSQIVTRRAVRTRPAS